MKSRIIIVFILLSVLWGALLTRTAFLQILPNERLESLRKKQFETVVTLRSRRGDVFDRHGHELAISTASHSLFADPKLLEAPLKTARLLAKELKLPYRPLADRLRHRKNRFTWIQRHLNGATKERIERLKIRGLGFVEESKRTYPNEKLLAHVLGFVGSEGEGLEGLEARYNDQLQINKKKVSIQRDARGRPLIVGGQLFTEAPDGADVHLTIDRELQFILEQELKLAVDQHQADSAVGVILNAQTSEVLAMANAPSFNPNKHGEFIQERRRNRAVTDAFEPGSTMKTFVVAGALARGLVEPNTKFDCEDGTFRIGKQIIREADEQHRFKKLTVSEILSYSSNIGATKIAFKLDSRNLFATLSQFGFGERTGIDLPGEAKGIMLPLPWRDHLLSNISFGHGISVTPLQIANAYAAIANGGWLKRPFIVSRIQDYDTGEETRFEPKTMRRVLLPEAASRLKLILSAATSAEATGWNARVVGFPVAGKTGTAQKVKPSGGYYTNAYISSFAGFLPVNDPKFVIYIAVDNPKKSYYGSQVAAPVFSRIASFAVRQAGLSPVMITAEDLVPQSDRPFRFTDLDTEGLAIARKRAAIGPLKQADVGGVRDAVVGAANGVLINDVIPDLTGLSLREVVRRMRGTGLLIQTRGQGFVRHSYPAAGTPMSGPQTLTVFLEPDSRNE